MHLVASKTLSNMANTTQFLVSGPVWLCSLGPGGPKGHHLHRFWHSLCWAPNTTQRWLLSLQPTPPPSREAESWSPGDKTDLLQVNKALDSQVKGSTGASSSTVHSLEVHGIPFPLRKWGDCSPLPHHTQLHRCASSLLLPYFLSQLHSLGLSQFLAGFHPSHFSPFPLTLVRSRGLVYTSSISGIGGILGKSGQYLSFSLSCINFLVWVLVPWSCEMLTSGQTGWRVYKNFLHYHGNPSVSQKLFKTEDFLKRYLGTRIPKISPNPGLTLPAASTSGGSVCMLVEAHIPSPPTVYALALLMLIYACLCWDELGGGQE